MASLSARVRVVEMAEPSSEDILSDWAETLYPDRYRNIHGDPDSDIIYISQRFGDIALRTAASNGGDDYFLFAHYLWNASIQLADLIETADTPDGTSNASSQQPLDWSVKEETVLELGAGRL